MSAILPNRSSIAQSVLVAGITAAAVALLGAVLAYWTWVWLAPRPQPRLQQAVQQNLAPESAFGLFGGGGQGAAETAPTQIAITLLGVVAPSGNSAGYALFRLNSKKTVAVTQGHQIEAGVRLAEVHPDHVVIDRGGIRETLAWPRKSGPPAPFTAAPGRQ